LQTNPSIKITALSVAFILFGLIAKASASPADIGSGELSRLIETHTPLPPPFNPADLKLAQRSVQFPGQTEPTLLEIPGFENYACNQCHQSDDLFDRAEKRITNVLARLKSISPESGTVPLNQYIIQPWAGPLLTAQQYAHATFDAIRLFPRTILVDQYVYNNNTHLHEILHLTQTFLGHSNELEAYGLNAQEDARFLLLNFPYFENIVSAFYAEDFKNILKEYFARPVDDGFIPREVQWYINEFDPEKINKLSAYIVRMKPLLDKAARLNREFPLQAAYLSEQTGIPSLLLDLAAVQVMELPEITLPQETQDKAYALLEEQMNKTDNILLGYIINRKDEALLHMRYTLNISEPAQRLALYFHYLKQWKVNPDGAINFSIPLHLEDYVEKKLRQVDRLLEYQGISTLEKAGGKRFKKRIQEELQKIETTSPQK
jgi:hypothetical protein